MSESSRASSSRLQPINQLSGNGLRLVTLGTLALRSPGGDEDATLARRRFKLALLAVLALAGRPVARDTLIALFWPEQDEARARHSLSDALSHLRRVLGPRAISTRQAEVALTDEAHIDVDALAFATAVEANDDERAVALYEGPFLDAVHLSASQALEDWCARHRSRLDALFARACLRRCEVLARSRAWDACADLSLRWLAAAPLSADAALYRLNALKAAGTPDADRRALEEYQRLAAHLAQDYGRGPDRVVVALAEDIAARAVRLPAVETPTPTPASVEIVPSVAAVARGIDLLRASNTGSVGSAHADAPYAPPWRWVPRALRSRRFALLVVTALLGGAAMAAFLARAPTVRGASALHAPVVAIVGITNVRSDTAAAWMSEGLASMIAAKLSRDGAVEIVPPERVREVRERARWQPDRVPSPADARELGSRVGADWVVTGGLTRGDTALVLELVVRDVASGRVVRLDAVEASNVLALADVSASRVLAAAGASSPGPHLADIETANLEAFGHYARFTLARSEGRVDDAVRELDAAIAMDSGFVTALRDRVTYALIAKDEPTLRTLAAAFRRHDNRATDWDRLTLALQDAYHTGERLRSEALARALVSHYPHDPRAYELLRNVYLHHGRWAMAEQAALSQLALDSLATLAGEGPCVPCAAYRGLSDVRLVRGDYPGAIAALRRLLVLEPALSDEWVALSAALAANQQYDAALAAAHRAVALSADGTGAVTQLARLLIQMRRYEEAETLVRRLETSPSRDQRENGSELRVTLDREEGRFRAANATLDMMIRTYPGARELALLQGDGLGKLGDRAGAERTFERLYHGVTPTLLGALPNTAPLAGDRARAFCWFHALEVDAIGVGGDTVRFHVLADSLELVGQHSYYGRDWQLHHHLRGLIAMRGQRYAEAAREFAAARWGRTGWGRTIMAEAEAQLAMGLPVPAITTLRAAYSAPLDGMGRYPTRTELDELMARAFSVAGARDSAVVYAGYVRTAWRHADPEIARRVASLP
ncbi:MAG: BTAD domain-containing putative transcriptional regulator [bacterium]